MIRAYKYRCEPTAAQAALLETWQRACWHLQKAAIRDRRLAWQRRLTLPRLESDRAVVDGRKRRKLPTVYEQSRAMTDVRQWEEEQDERAKRRAFISGREVQYTPEEAAQRRDNPPWYLVPRDPMEAVLWRVENAYQAFRKDPKRHGRPRWADAPADVSLEFRGEDRGTVRWPQDAQRARARGRAYRYAFWGIAGAGDALGKLKVREHRALPAGAVVRQATISRQVDGWYLSLTCDVPPPAPEPPRSNTIGVDMNVQHEGARQRVAVLSDGRVYHQDDRLQQTAARLAHMQRMVDPRRTVHGAAKAAAPDSKRTARRRERIARLHQRVARQRDHQQQYIARRIVDTAQVIGVEDVDWRNLKRQGKARAAGDNRRGGRKVRRGLNRALTSAAPGRLRALIADKGQLAGRTVVEVSARHTSQACSACGTIGEKKTLSVRVWTCGACGAEHDRDVNAAQNIARRAKAEVMRSAASSAALMTLTPVVSTTNPDSPGGLRGEGAAGVFGNARSMNREGAAAPPAEQQRAAQSAAQRWRQLGDEHRARNSPAKPRTDRVSGTLDMFGGIPDG